MKKIILILFIFCSVLCKAHPLQSTLNGIAYVESKHNPKAKNGICIGYLQIMPCLVKDVNEYLKLKGSKKRYSLVDRWDKQKSIEMFYLYQERYNPSNNIKKAIKIWKCGPYSHKTCKKYETEVLKHSKL